MRILVLSRSPWRNDNSTGRTLSDIMSAFPKAEFYSLSMRDQASQNSFAKENFKISEKQIINHILHKKPVGTIELNSQKDADSILYENNKAKSNIFLWFIREFIWSVGGWKNKNLEEYINKVNPDIVFSPIFPGCYPQKLLLHIKKVSGAKAVIFHMDDNYSLKRFSLSPFFWIYRFWMRKWVKKSNDCADLVYVISEIQKKDYETAFKKECKILTKSADFLGEPPIKKLYNRPLQLVFTGNIGLNRWRSLAEIAKTLEKINENGVKAQLRIYTGNTVTDEMNKALNLGESSFVMGSISSDKVEKVQKDADMLVHVESTDLKNKLLVRQSFSTKIVDYLAAARPILAFGPKDVASINYFIENDCAIVADTKNELYEKLIKVLENPRELNALAQKAFNCGRKNHNKFDIDNMLREDFEKLLK